MKILHIPLKTHHDFQCETISWGLRGLRKTHDLEIDKLFYTEKLFKKTTPQSHISPHYTYYRHWDESMPDMNLDDIDYKLKHKYYDLVILHDGLDREREYGHNKYIDQLDYIYNIYHNKLFIVDGEDIGDDEYLKNLKNYPDLKYFRRELTYTLKYQHKNLFPINFGFPDELILDEKFEKKQLISTIVPGDGNTYIYSSEQDYYDEYRKSKFAFTFSKGGWDCLRHLEIIFNKSLPIFLDLEFCANGVLHFYPKFEMREILHKMCHIKYDMYDFDSINKFGKNEYWKRIINNNYITIKDESCYDEIQSNIYTHCKKHLTCNNIVKYLLEHYD